MVDGQIIGRLVVISDDGFDVTTGGHKKRKVKVRCECGTTKSVRVNDLQSGRVVSCGCHRREVTTRRSTTHSMSADRIYDIWAGLVKRCTNPKSKDYNRYSHFNNDADWLQSFEAFYNDMGDSYFDGSTIDRIDTTRGYCKQNCRWVIPALQARNLPKTKANTSGQTGVSFTTSVKDNIIYTFVIAYWREDGKRKSKCFSVQHFGLLEAFAKAVKFRKEQIIRLNSLGYGYTDTHGC